MYRDSEQALESIFVSYNKILKRIKLLSVTTKYGKEITHKDLRKAIEVMLKKHPTCRWRSEKVKSRKYFILAEGYAWLLQVYFNKEKSLIDADVDFFEDRIRQYEELLKVEHNENLWNEDMNIKQLCEYFNKKLSSLLYASELTSAFTSLWMSFSLPLTLASAEVVPLKASLISARLVSS